MKYWFSVKLISVKVNCTPVYFGLQRSSVYSVEEVCLQIL